MTYTFSAIEVEQRLKLFLYWKILAFGTFLLMRALPNFLQFETETGALGGSILLGALGKSWHVMQTGESGPFIKFNSQICDFYAPDTDNFSSIYTSAALDAFTISSNIMEFIENSDVNLIVESSSVRHDTIDIFIQTTEGLDPNSRDLEESIRLHPLMQAELAFQNEDLHFLMSMPPDQTLGWRQVLFRSLEQKYGIFTLNRR